MLKKKKTNTNKKNGHDVAAKDRQIVIKDKLMSHCVKLL